MGAVFSAKDKVSPEKREDNGISGDFEGPTKNRTCTDVIWLFIIGIFIIIFFSLLQHSIRNGDLFRIINGYDNCGNVCGRVTEASQEKELDCTGANMTTRKYLLIRGLSEDNYNPLNVNKECVTSCQDYPNYRKFMNRCIPKKGQKIVNSFFSNTGLRDFFHEVSEDLNLCWPQIVQLCIFALAMSFLVLVLFRFLAKFVVWLVLISTVLVSIAATIYLWITWNSRSNGNDNSSIGYRVMDTYLAFAISATIVTVCIIAIILVMRKRVALVVQLFEESSKAVTAMPLLIPLPLLTYVALAVVMTLSIYFSLWIESSGFLTFRRPNYYFKKDTIMKITRWVNLLGMFWFTQICFSCQHMIIAGSVATWFFTRSKETLQWPISRSFFNLIRYHLGSVVFGSFLIALIQVVRTIIEYIHKRVKHPENNFTKIIFKVCQCCLYCFEKFITYLSRNAFIEIAIFGHSFCEGGQQAFKLLTNNALRVAAINSVGDFVLFLGKVLVVISTVFLGTYLIENVEGVQHMWTPLIIAGIFAYFIAHCFMTLYEMVIDTIFLCFCEDCELNDGISKPYFMNKGLMEFVKNSKKTLAVGDSPRRST